MYIHKYIIIAVSAYVDGKIKILINRYVLKVINKIQQKILIVKCIHIFSTAGEM